MARNGRLWEHVRWIESRFASVERGERIGRRRNRWSRPSSANGSCRSIRLKHPCIIRVIESIGMFNSNWQEGKIRVGKNASYGTHFLPVIHHFQFLRFCFPCCNLAWTLRGSIQCTLFSFNAGGGQIILLLLTVWKDDWRSYCTIFLFFFFPNFSSYNPFYLTRTMRNNSLPPTWILDHFFHWNSI